MIEWLVFPLVSFFIGSGIYIFMEGLSIIVDFFQAHPQLVYLLPAAGLVVFLLEQLPVFKKLGDTETILEEIHNPRQRIPWILAPWICVMTWWSQLFGASSGREGTAIQIGATLSEFAGDLFQRASKQTHLHRPLLLRMGLAGGFAAAFGAPIAGALFAVEHPGKFHKALVKEFPLLLATSWSSLKIAELLGLHHLTYSFPYSFDFLLTPLSWILISLGFALMAGLYQFCFSILKENLLKIPRLLSLVGGGTVLAIVAFLLHSTEWHGLGTGLIAKSLSQPTGSIESLLKISLTMLTVASGFRGGEVVPLMAGGALFGNYLAQVFALPIELVGAAGIAVLFSHRMRSPLAGFFFLLERFNPGVALFGALALFLSWLSRKHLKF